MKFFKEWMLNLLAITIKNFTSTITGTPHYIGPEVLMGKGYSFSCDFLYSAVGNRYTLR